MSTLSQSERQSLNEIFGVLAEKETRTSKVKNVILNVIYFVKYFLKDKKSTRLSPR